MLDMGYEILKVCAPASGSTGLVKGFSGQTFTADNGGHNVVIAYCDPNDPTTSKPGDYSEAGPHWGQNPGPNSTPYYTCSGIGEGCFSGPDVVSPTPTPAPLAG